MLHTPTNRDHRSGADADDRVEAPSVLTKLRALSPPRRITLTEALWIAELQADRFLQLRGRPDIPIPLTIVSDLPRITVEHDPDLPAAAASGCSDWDSHRKRWIISLNPEEPLARRRFTTFHEYKHILDHCSLGIRPTSSRRPPEEIVADYFAGCALMPKRSVKGAFFDGIQRPADLADLFDVSERAMVVRLSQLGLGEPNQVQRRPRYRPQSPPTGRYLRIDVPKQQQPVLEVTT